MLVADDRDVDGVAWSLKPGTNYVTR